MVGRTSRSTLDTVTDGITASVIQTQGQGALVSQINEVSVVANTNDTVTLPSATPGFKITIINDGANLLQIFPASDDNLGNGIDVASVLEVNQSIDYVAYDDVNWHVEAETSKLHAGIYDQDNTDAFVINDAGGDFHAYHTNNIIEGIIRGFTFDAGGAGTSFPIVSIANDTGGKVLVTTTGSHGLAVGDIISQTDLADGNYVGLFIVQTVPSSTTYTVIATWGATGTGTMDQGWTLTANTGSDGDYFISWSASATTATNNDTFDFELCKNATTFPGTKVRRKFGTGNDFGSFGGVTTGLIVGGDKISMALSNEDSADNVTIRNLTVAIMKL